MRKVILPVLLLAAAGGCAPKPEQAAGSPPQGQNAAPTGQSVAYRIDKVSLPGEGRGDYITVDPDAQRLYVTHTGVVHVLDLGSLKPIAEIGGLKKAHGVALVPAAGRGFISDGDGNQVLVFDLKNNQVTETLQGGQNPDSILYDPASKMVFVFNGRSKDVSVIDPAKAEIIKTLPLGDKPEFSRADGKGTIFVNLEEGAEIALIDTATLSVAKTYKLTDCDGAAALGFDGANRRLFSGCGNRQMKVVDADSGKVLASLPIGEDADGIAFDPEEKRIYVANRDGTMTVVRQDDADHYSVEQDLATEEYAKTIAVDLKTHRVFSSTADLIWPQAEPGKKHLPDAKSGTFRLLVISRS
jgi:DNA-binding beta-propeller fold protein YncE